MIVRFLLAIVLGVVVIIFLLRVGAVRRPGLRAVERIYIDDHPSDRWIELRLSDGSVWRSQHEILWYSFPNGNRAPLDFESFLEGESKRLALLDKWSEASR